MFGDCEAPGASIYDTLSPRGTHLKANSPSGPSCQKGDKINYEMCHGVHVGVAATSISWWWHMGAIAAVRKDVSESKRAPVGQQNTHHLTYARLPNMLLAH